MRIRNIILTLLIPIIILLANFAFLAFNEKYYERQYTKNAVYDQIPKEQVDGATEQLINYLRDGKELQGDYFNAKEKEHLKDVRNIINFLMITLSISIMVGAAIIVISFKKNKRLFGMSLIAGGLLTILLIVGLYFILTNFHYAFLKSHELTFNNELWLLDPATDKLIVMFPENFFYGITQNIVVRSLITAVATTAIGALFLRKHKIQSSS